VIVMPQYLLALYRECAVPTHPGQAQQLSTGVNALGDKLTDPGAFVFKTGLLPEDSGTVASMTEEQAS
jgi:hypothetical protein